MSEENKNVRCDLCGEEVSSQNAIRFDGTILCTDCFNQRVTECSHCGRSIWRGQFEERRVLPRLL